MRILHIVAGLSPESGIAVVVLALANAQTQLGHQAKVLTLSDDAGGTGAEGDDAPIPVVRFRRAWPKALCWSWGLFRALPRLVRKADAVHVHSNWTFPVWWGCLCALMAGKWLVMSPHGNCDPVRLRHSAWKKRAVAWLDRALLRRANAIHATSEAEAEWVKKFLKIEQSKAPAERGCMKRRSTLDARRSTLSSPASKDQPKPRIVVIPNGVEMALGSGQLAVVREAGTSGPRTVLYLGRLHPLKGLELLVEAWGILRQPSRPLYG
ncbi:MAG: glycosyltransferase, partial [Kiritimatiellae bacterium]|nr:glycosyltransferase [Kiritimatiellia bacterium]